jgi:hypothetical protein
MNIYIAKDGQQLGPFSLADVQNQLIQGVISREDLAFHDGLSEWKPLEAVLAAIPPDLPMPAAANRASLPRFAHNKYLVRRKIFTLWGGAFHIFDAAGNVVLYSRLKAFKLKEDIRLYTGEDMATEVLVIKARKILDFSSAYDVFDPSLGGAKIGALKRKGLKSILKDEWIFMDATDREIGLITEDTVLLALLRRFLTNLIPQSYDGTINGSRVCHFKQNFNPFVMKVTLDFSPDQSGLLDHRLGLAAAVLLCAIEGKQG